MLPFYQRKVLLEYYDSVVVLLTVVVPPMLADQWLACLQNEIQSCLHIQLFFMAQMFKNHATYLFLENVLALISNMVRLIKLLSLVLRWLLKCFSGLRVWIMSHSATIHPCDQD